MRGRAPRPFLTSGPGKVPNPFPNAARAAPRMALKLPSSLNGAGGLEGFRLGCPVLAALPRCLRFGVPPRDLLSWQAHIMEKEGRAPPLAVPASLLRCCCGTLAAPGHVRTAFRKGGGIRPPLPRTRPGASACCWPVDHGGTPPLRPGASRLRLHPFRRDPGGSRALAVPVRAAFRTPKAAFGGGVPPRGHLCMRPCGAGAAG